ncbi:MAG: NDP-sugar synthase [Bacteroidales bacterium]
MHYAIIAAGNGSRLVAEGVATPKPLVKVNGEPLIDRLVRIFSENNAESISIILNSNISSLIEHFENLKSDVVINIVNKSTISSMHSFYELSRFLNNGKFCLTTVDTIFKEDEFSDFIKEFEQNTVSEGIMGVTNFIDDEKPLYVSTDTNMRITGFYDTPNRNADYISGGIYALTPICIKVLEHSIHSGMSRMRNYQRALVEDGIRLRAYPFTKIIDIDHAIDITAANNFLLQNV